MKPIQDFQIEIINNQDFIPVDEKRLSALTEKTLTLLNADRAILNVLIVDNEAIHEINNQFLQHDFPTDVITFPIHDDSQLSGKQPLEGEIVISAQMAKEIAETVSWPALHELSLYLIHALLHLCGYDDLNEQDQKRMRKKERELLIATNIQPQLNDPRWQDLE